MVKIYWRWRRSKYEFYIDTGERMRVSGLTKFGMICVNIVRGKVSNKRGRIKKALLFSPKQILSVIEETWCILSEREKKQYIELTNEEFKNLKIQYNI